MVRSVKEKRRQQKAWRDGERHDNEAGWKEKWKVEREEKERGREYDKQFGGWREARKRSSRKRRKERKVKINRRQNRKS